MAKPNKKGESFNLALIVIFLSIAVSAIAFMSESNKVTGFVTSGSGLDYSVHNSNIREFRDVASLNTLAPGNYFIGGNGIVYWADDNSRPAVARVTSLYEVQKNKYIYIDDDGNIGYTIS